MNRRSLLKGAGVALAAVTIPATARAASDEGGLLLGLWRREAAAAFAYYNVLYTDPLLIGLAGQEVDHARAIATELAAVGLGTPRGPRTTEDLDIAAQRLAGAGTKRPETLAAAIALEEGLVELYKGALPALPDAKIAMTAATILASHSQHLFILRSAAGVP